MAPSHTHTLCALFCPTVPCCRGWLASARRCVDRFRSGKWPIVFGPSRRPSLADWRVVFSEHWGYSTRACVCVSVWRDIVVTYDVRAALFCSAQGRAASTLLWVSFVCNGFLGGYEKGGGEGGMEGRTVNVRAAHGKRPTNRKRRFCYRFGAGAARFYFYLPFVTPLGAGWRLPTFSSSNI